MMTSVVGAQLVLWVLLSFVSYASLAPTDPNWGLPKETINEMREAFEEFDKDGDGKISIDELRSVMIECGEQPSEECLQEIIEKLDKHGTGGIAFDEFLGLMVPNLTAEEEELKRTFRSLDQNGNGKISNDEFHRFLTQSVEGHFVDRSEQRLRSRLVNEMANNPDGEVNFEGFKKIMKASKYCIAKSFSAVAGVNDN